MFYDDFVSPLAVAVPSDGSAVRVANYIAEGPMSGFDGDPVAGTLQLDPSVVQPAVIEAHVCVTGLADANNREVAVRVYQGESAEVATRIVSAASWHTAQTRVATCGGRFQLEPGHIVAVFLEALDGNDTTVNIQAVQFGLEVVDWLPPKSGT
jgi:hypothetical protein